jgi:hypothetical protein
MVNNKKKDAEHNWDSYAGAKSRCNIKTADFINGILLLLV